MTPYVLILFKFLGVGHLDIAEERVVDTIHRLDHCFYCQLLGVPKLGVGTG